MGSTFYLILVLLMVMFIAVVAAVVLICLNFQLFRVAQLMIEYLLYVQEQLATNMNTLATKYSEKKRLV